MEESGVPSGVSHSQTSLLVEESGVPSGVSHSQASLLVEESGVPSGVSYSQTLSLYYVQTLSHSVVHHQLTAHSSSDDRH